MNDQEIFDTVAKHLLAQGRKSMTESGLVCAYRGRDGLRCAIGCLIPDDRYTASLETLGIGCRLVIDALPWGLGLHQGELLNKLQWIHDVENVDRWRSALRELAVGRGLGTGVLE